jgi:hypothetical protein
MPLGYTPCYAVHGQMVDKISRLAHAQVPDLLVSSLCLKALEPTAGFEPTTRGLRILIRSFPAVPPRSWGA